MCSQLSSRKREREVQEKKALTSVRAEKKGKTKGEISGQIDQPAIPNTTKRGDEFTRVSKRCFYPPSKPLSTKYTYHCNWSPFDKLCREKAEEQLTLNVLNVTKTTFSYILINLKNSFSSTFH